MSGSNATPSGSNQPFILVESNLEILPVFQMTGRARDTTPYTLTWSAKTQDGSQITKSWTVQPHQEYGAPRGRDQDVFIAVLTVMERQGGMPENGEVLTTRSELLSVLGWPTNGRHYQKLRESLERIDRTPIVSRDAFYHQDTESWLDGSFNIWDAEFWTTRRRKNGRNEERVKITFDGVLIRSFLAAYLKGLDTEFYWSLSSHLAKRMYRLVDRMRGKRLDWQEDLFRLQEQIPIGPYQYPSHIRQKLEPAHEELLSKGFLEQALVDADARRAHYRVTQEFARRRETFEVADSGAGMSAMDFMGSVGMPVTEAQKLVAEYGAERCLACVQALPLQRSIKKSPLAWLRWAVKEPEFDPYPYLRGEKGRVGGDQAADAAHRSQENRKQSGSPTQPRLGESEDTEIVQAEADPQALEVWNEVLEMAQKEINAPALTVWFEGTVPTSLEDGVLTLWAPNSFAREYIETRFREILEPHLSRILGREAAIEVEASE